MDNEREEIAATITGDGMPIGNILKLPIDDRDVEVSDDGSTAPRFVNDDAAATVVWMDYQKFKNWLEQQSWLMEWQYIDYMYQSPNYDRDFRTSNNRPARISRFDVAKNRNTMSCQVRRAIFADSQWFILEPRGRLLGHQNQELILSAWTEIFTVLCKRADLEYNMRLFIECQALQGTAIAVPQWEQKPKKRKRRRRKEKPAEIAMPLGNTKKVNTWKSDQTISSTDTELESWPSFEYRRLGTTLYNEKWRHPNKPEMSGFPRIDIDYVTFQDLQQYRELSCYKNIPDNENLITFFIQNPHESADPGTDTVLAMNTNSSVVVHAEGRHQQVSENPFEEPLMKLSYWTEDDVKELLIYRGRMMIIRNEPHDLGDHAAGYSANWFNIDDSGYGFGIGRLNVGDQRMTAGVLNEILKFIAFPLNAPLLYDKTSGNAPTQNAIAGLGNFLGVDTGASHDINKAFGFLRIPEIPPEVWKIYQLAHDGGQNVVGADEVSMQGQTSGPRTSFGRTATGASRLASKADENIADPVDQIERVLERFLDFLYMMVCDVMPLEEIRSILSDKFGETILEQIDSDEFLDARFEVSVLCGQKLAARGAIAQLIPFLLQIMQQPQLLEYLHQKGETVNFQAIANLFMRMSELAGREDIFVPLTQQQQQMVQQMQPGIQKIMADAQIEKLKGQNKIAEVQAKGAQDMQKTLVEKSLDHIEGAVPLDLAEARLARNTDMQELQNGIVG